MCLEGKAIEEIRNFLEWVGGTLVGTARSGVVGLAAAVLTLAAAFFLGFPVAGLGAAVDLCSGFLDLDIFLVVVTLGCLGASVTGWGEGFGFGGGVVVALMTRPPSDDVIPPLECWLSL